MGYKTLEAVSEKMWHNFPKGITMENNNTMFQIAEESLKITGNVLFQEKNWRVTSVTYQYKILIGLKVRIFQISIESQ